MVDEVSLLTTLRVWCDQTPITQVMRKAVTIHEQEAFHRVVELFRDAKMAHLVVVDDQDRYCGILSQKYVFKAQSPRKIISDDMNTVPGVIVDGNSFYDKSVLDSYILSKIMNRDAFTLPETATLSDVILEMAKRHRACVPVLNAQKSVLGVVTDYDLTAFWAHSMNLQ
jgi:acetoin utilization protein AcuB